MSLVPDRTASIRVLVIEPETLARESLVLALQRAAGFSARGCPPEPRQVVEAARAFTPHVGLLAVTPDGERVVEALAGGAPDVRILGVAPTPDLISAYRLMKLGVAGLIPSSVDIHEMLLALRAVASGYAVVAPDVLNGLMEQLASRGRGRFSAASQRLTPRQLRIVGAVSQGLTDAQIGRALGISASLIKAEVKSILRKTGARNRTEVVALALRRGLIS
ncbi:MAG: response regulator transcription factor [Bacillota bacterium]|nr:response regulator transcription factor [Bacillota bacterium]